MIHILNTDQSSIPLIRQLAGQIWPEAYRSILSPGQIGYMMEMMYSVDSLTEQMEQKKHRFLLICDDDRAVGFASYSYENKGNRIYLRLHKIYLDKTVRGKGFGLQVINHLKALAIQKKAEWIELNVNRKNPALEFYTRAGFEKAGEEAIDIGNGYIMDDYIMRMKM